MDEESKGPDLRKVPRFDWETAEADYRAGVMTIRAIARKIGCNEAAIRKRAAKDGWVRDLADKVRTAVRTKIIREQRIAHAKTVREEVENYRRQTEAEIIEEASNFGVSVIQLHQKSLRRAHTVCNKLSERLDQIIDGEYVELPCLGPKESPGDLLNKLSLVLSRLIPLEREAFGIDVPEGEGAPSKLEVSWTLPPLE